MEPTHKRDLMLTLSISDSSRHMPFMHTDSSSQGPWQPLACRGPDAQLFVIGDVHGQAKALAEAMTAMAVVPGISPHAE